MPHLPCRHLEASINERLQALHQPLGAGEALSCQERIKVPRISAHRERDVQDAPVQHWFQPCPIAIRIANEWQEGTDGILYHSRLRQVNRMITARKLLVLTQETSSSFMTQGDAVVLVQRASHLAANRRVRSLGAVLKCML